MKPRELGILFEPDMHAAIRGGREPLGLGVRVPETIWRENDARRTSGSNRHGHR